MNSVSIIEALLAGVKGNRRIARYTPGRLARSDGRFDQGQIDLCRPPGPTCCSGCSRHLKPVLARGIRPQAILEGTRPGLR